MLSQKHVIHYYLLSIRFPDWERHVQKYELESSYIRKSQDTSSNEILEYWKKLQSTPQDELHNLFDVARMQGQWRIDVEREVSQYLPDFDYRDATADFSRWALMAFWNAEESVALTLEKDPRQVTWSSVAPYVDVHPLATQFRDRLELIQREQVVGELEENIVPADLLAWAPGRIKVPPALEAAVRAVPPKRGLVAEIEALKAQLAKFGEQRSEKVNPNRRTSFLKLVLGMALRHYGHQPDSPRNSTARRMQDDLKRYGITLSEETIHDILVEGADDITFELDEKG
jgi:hypothetical protein